MTDSEIRRHFPLCRSINIGRDILLCFHHAGGSALIFRPWTKYDLSFDIVPVEISGRGTRSGEKIAGSVNEAAEDSASAIAEVFGDRNIYIYGHSLGSVIAFETANRLSDMGIEVQRLFAAGRAAPDHPEPSPYRCSMGLDALKAELKRIGATPEEVLEDRYFNENLLPVIYSDYKISEEYAYSGTAVRYPITALCGSEDTDADMSLMKGWGDMTDSDFSIYEFPGGHFFPYQDSKVLKTISGEIMTLKVH